MAVPQDHGHLQRAEAGGPREAFPRNNGPGDRRILFRHQGQVAPGQRAGSAHPGRERQAPLRHHRHLDTLEAYRRRIARHRLHQRLAHADVRHQRKKMVRRSSWISSRCPRRCSPRSWRRRRNSASRKARRDCRTASSSAASPATSRPPWWARTASPPGSLKNTYGTGCFMLMNNGENFIISRNGLLTTLACDNFGHPVYALEGSVFIGGAVVQWLRDYLKFFDDSADSEEMAQLRRQREPGGPGAGLCGAGRPALEHGRPGRHLRLDQGHDPRGNRHGGAEIDRAPVARPGGSDAGGHRDGRAGAARRRRGDQERLPDAVPVGHPQHPGAACRRSPSPRPWGPPIWPASPEACTAPSAKLRRTNRISSTYKPGMSKSERDHQIRISGKTQSEDYCCNDTAQPVIKAYIREEHHGKTITGRNTA